MKESYYFVQPRDRQSKTSNISIIMIIKEMVSATVSKDSFKQRHTCTAAFRLALIRVERDSRA